MGTGAQACQPPIAIARHLLLSLLNRVPNGDIAGNTIRADNSTDAHKSLYYKRALVWPTRHSMLLSGHAALSSVREVLAVDMSA